MSSINGSTPPIPAYQPVNSSTIDHGRPQPNAIEQNAVGEDVEDFGENGPGIKPGDEYRAHANRQRIEQEVNRHPIDDGEIYPDGNGGSVIEGEEQHTIDREIQPDGKGGYVMEGEEQHTIDREIQPDGKGGYVMEGEEQHTIDREIQPDGKGGWKKA